MPQRIDTDSRSWDPGTRPVSQSAIMEPFDPFTGVPPWGEQTQIDSNREAQPITTDGVFQNEPEAHLPEPGNAQYVGVGLDQILAMQTDPRVALDMPQPGEIQQAQIMSTISFPNENDEAKHFTKLFKQSKKLTDEALIKRTQLAQEMDTLTHTMNYLKNSTAELMANLHHLFDSPSATAKEQKRSKKRAKRTQEILKEPTGRPDELISPPETIGSTDSTGEKVQTVSDSGIGSSKPESAPTSGANKLYGQYCKDYDAFMDREAIVKRLMNELSNVEYDLRQKQEAMQKRMTSKNLADELRAEILDLDTDVSESSMPERTSNATPPLVRQYFDRQGDVGIFRERLVELDYTHEEGKMERDFLRDRGDPVDPPDSQFEFNYKSRRQHIISELEKAQREAGALRKECDNAGFNTESHRESMHYLQSDGSPAPSVNDLPEREQSPSPVQAIQMPAPISQFGGPGRSQQRVDEWLRELSTTPGTGGLEQPEYDVETPEFEKSGDMPIT